MAVRPYIIIAFSGGKRDSRALSNDCRDIRHHHVGVGGIGRLDFICRRDRPRLVSNDVVVVDEQRNISTVLLRGSATLESRPMRVQSTDRPAEIVRTRDRASAVESAARCRDARVSETARL